MIGGSGLTRIARTEGELGTGRVVILDPRRVKPFAGQPRKRFRGIEQLAQSIRIVGQITPVIVTRSASTEYDAELVDGERRLRACLTARLPVKAVFEDALEEDRHVRSVAANFCRQQHDPVEIMEAVTTLKTAGRSIMEISAIFGKSPSWVMQHASLRKLHPEVLEHLKVPGDEVRLTRQQRRAKGRVSFSVALLLSSMDPQQQLAALERIVRGKMGMTEAKTAVAETAAAAGRSVGRNRTNPQRFRSVLSAVTTCSHMVERYLSMPGVEINALLAAATGEERRTLTDRLESLTESLLLLSDALGWRPTTDGELKVGGV